MNDAGPCGLTAAMTLTTCSVDGRARPAPATRTRQGPGWRIVYWVRETPDRRLRVIVVLAVGIAHPNPGAPSAFDLATGMLQTLIKERP